MSSIGCQDGMLVCCMQVDVECANWLAECQVPFALVFTKVSSIYAANRSKACMQHIMLAPPLHCAPRTKLCLQQCCYIVLFTPGLVC